MRTCNFILAQLHNILDNVPMVKLGQIILFSNNSKRLATFLCDLFDLELSPAEDAIGLSNGEVSFLVIERPKLAEFGSSTLIDFIVESSDDLDELHSKIEFLNYRLESSGESLTSLQTKELPEIRDLGNVRFFFMTDPDGRRWKISYFQ